MTNSTKKVTYKLPILLGGPFTGSPSFTEDLFTERRPNISNSKRPNISKSSSDSSTFRLVVTPPSKAPLSSHPNSSSSSPSTPVTNMKTLSSSSPTTSIETSSSTSPKLLSVGDQSTRIYKMTTNRRTSITPQGNSSVIIKK